MARRVAATEGIAIRPRLLRMTVKPSDRSVNEFGGMGLLLDQETRWFVRGVLSKGYGL